MDPDPWTWHATAGDGVSVGVVDDGVDVGAGMNDPLLFQKMTVPGKGKVLSGCLE